jgi:hypothetical protein
MARKGIEKPQPPEAIVTRGWFRALPARAVVAQPDFADIRATPSEAPSFGAALRGLVEGASSMLSEGKGVDEEGPAKHLRLLATPSAASGPLLFTGVLEPGVVRLGVVASPEQAAEVRVRGANHPCVFCSVEALLAVLLRDVDPLANHRPAVLRGHPEVVVPAPCPVGVPPHPRLDALEAEEVAPPGVVDLEKPEIAVAHIIGRWPR